MEEGNGARGQSPSTISAVVEEYERWVEESCGGTVVIEPVEHHPIVIVTGSRNLKEWWRVWWVLDQYRPTTVVEGNCPTGADAAARRWLTNNGLSTRSYTAHWREHGGAAGPMRNARMLRDWPSARVLAFPDEGSKGTVDCMRQAWGREMVVENFSGVVIMP